MQVWGQAIRQLGSQLRVMVTEQTYADNQKVQQYARRSRILMEFFDSLEDYAALKPDAARITRGPGKYQANLASNKEAVVYLHTDAYGERIAAGQPLVMDGLPLASGKVSATLVQPASGVQENHEAAVRDGRLEITLPAFLEDLAVHVRLRPSER